MDKPPTLLPGSKNEKTVVIRYISGGVTEFKSDAAVKVIEEAFNTGRMNDTSLISLPYYGRNLIVNMRNVSSIEV